MSRPKAGAQNSVESMLSRYAPGSRARDGDVRCVWSEGSLIARVLRTRVWMGSSVAAAAFVEEEAVAER